MQFEVTATGVNSLTEEIEKEIVKIDEAIEPSLLHTGAELAHSLQMHLAKEWYSAYTPTVYERRSDNPSLGTSIMDDSVIDYFISEKRGMNFLYTPTGEHQNAEWHERDGNELIEYIQMGGGGTPPRPFWNNFVEEARNGGIMQAFQNGMEMRGIVVISTGNDIIMGEGESKLQAQEEIKM